MKFFAPFLTNSVTDFQAPSAVTGMTNIEALAKFDAGEIQLEFMRTSQSSQGFQYAPGGITPAAYLSPFMDLWLYNDLPHPPDYRYLGPSSLPDYMNVYWHRRMMLELAEQKGWYLFGNHWIYGQDSVVHLIDDPCDPDYRKYRPHIDLSMEELIDWYVASIVDSGATQLVIDDAYLTGRYAHYRPWASGVSDDALNNGLLTTCRRLRNAGVKVILNGGWSMHDPDASKWTYPALEADAVDGVMAEVRVDGQQGGFSRADGGAYWCLNDSDLPRLIGDWQDAGKLFVLHFRWNDNDARFQSYDAMARHYVKYAADADCWLSPTNKNYSAPHWLPWFAEYQNEPISMADAFRQAADERQTISGNFNAALQKAIFADGYFPVETEFEFEFGGNKYMLQKAEDSDSFAPRVYAAPWGRWEEVFALPYSEEVG